MKQLIIILLMGIGIYLPLKVVFPIQINPLEEIFLTFVLTNIPVAFSFPPKQRTFIFSLYHPLKEIHRAVCSKSRECCNMDLLHIDHGDPTIASPSYRGRFPFFSGVDAQYIPLLCQLPERKRVSRVKIRVFPPLMFAPDATVMRPQYTSRDKYVILHQQPLEEKQKMLIIYQLNLNQEAVKIRNGRILLCLRSRIDYDLFRRYYILELQLFEGKCGILTQRSCSNCLTCLLRYIWLKYKISHMSSR